MALHGKCHCGKFAFEVDGQLPAELTRCTCSFCAARGMLYAYYAPEQLRVTTPMSDLATYRWQSQLVGHYFCPQCGCSAFSDSPAFAPDKSWDGHTRRIGLNARLIADFDAAAAPVKVIDGKNLW